MNYLERVVSNVIQSTRWISYGSRSESPTCEALGTADFSMNRPLYGHKKLVHRGWRSRGGMPANYCDTTEIEEPAAFV